MTNADLPLPDEAMSYPVAASRSQAGRARRDHTLVGWFGVWLLTLLLLVPLLGAGMAIGRLAGRMLVQFLH